MAEIIRWYSGSWVLTVESKGTEIRWSLNAATPISGQNRYVVFRCPKSVIHEIITALTKLAPEGEE